MKSDILGLLEQQIEGMQEYWSLTHAVNCGKNKAPKTRNSEMKTQCFEGPVKDVNNIT